ncbi:SRPBCC domain-containing protein [Streptomyces sp. NPDC052727]|uniref:SRPBCC domain-containing protein n=1 Tax=Streptomyces sp. NPDC052727 TaxID=3154854 RepID=UPI0034415B94
MTSVPRPHSRSSGVVEVEVPAYDNERMLSLRWADADPADPPDGTITWTLEHEGRGTRLFLVACPPCSWAEAGTASVKRTSRL